MAQIPKLRIGKCFMEKQDEIFVHFVSVTIYRINLLYDSMSKALYMQINN